jgi:hypothetical protein
VAIDDGIARAIKIGEENKRIIELARDWCAHIEELQLRPISDRRTAFCSDAFVWASAARA